MKEISVLGVSMTDRSLRESLRLLPELMDGEGLGTVCFLDTELLIKAKDDEELKKALESADMLIPASPQILEAGGIRSGSRIREVSENFFLRETLKRLAREKKKIFLLADTQDDLVRLREHLLSVSGKLTFFGSFAWDGPDRSDEAVVNAINSVLPDVIISVAASPFQELLMYRMGSMVNARLWISFQSAVRDALGSGGPGFFSSVIDRFIFKRTLKRFEDKEL